MPYIPYYGFNILQKGYTGFSRLSKVQGPEALGWESQAICVPSQPSPLNPTAEIQSATSCLNFSLKKEGTEATRKEALEYKPMG